MSSKLNKTEKASLVFIGLAYLFVGMLILAYPRSFYYWVAGIFVIQGIVSLVNAWRK